MKGLTEKLVNGVTEVEAMKDESGEKGAEVGSIAVTTGNHQHIIIESIGEMKGGAEVEVLSMLSSRTRQS